MIYILDTDFLKDKAIYTKTYDNLPNFRKEKADKYRFEKDRFCSVGVWALFQYALKNTYGITDTDVSYNEYGKPFLKKYSNIDFSLSHSGGKVMCAVSDKNIGCDVQYLKESNNMLDSVAKRFFTDKEYRYIESFAPNERILQFTRIWTAKESYIKAIGTGLATELASFEVMPSKQGINISDEEYFCHEINACEGYCFTYCSLYAKEDNVEIKDML